MLRVVLALLAAIAVHGCTWYVYDATTRPIAANVVGRCFALREDAILAEHFSYFTAYMLSVPGANECTPRDVTPATREEERYKTRGLSYPKCPWIPVARVDKGARFRVTEVTEQPYGGPGRCWKVDITFVSGRNVGLKSGIPACHFDFPESELWLRMTPGHGYVEPLMLSERVAGPCAD